MVKGVNICVPMKGYIKHVLCSVRYELQCRFILMALRDLIVMEIHDYAHKSQVEYLTNHHAKNNYITWMNNTTSPRPRIKFPVYRLSWEDRIREHTKNKRTQEEATSPPPPRWAAQAIAILFSFVNVFACCLMVKRTLAYAESHSLWSYAECYTSLIFTFSDT
jgi:hypothetical protein